MNAQVICPHCHSQVIIETFEAQILQCCYCSGNFQNPQYDPEIPTLESTGPARPTPAVFSPVANPRGYVNSPWAESQIPAQQDEILDLDSPSQSKRRTPVIFSLILALVFIGFPTAILLGYHWMQLPVLENPREVATQRAQDEWIRVQDKTPSSTSNQEHKANIGKVSVQANLDLRTQGRNSRVVIGGQGPYPAEQNAATSKQDHLKHNTEAVPNNAVAGKVQMNTESDEVQADVILDFDLPEFTPEQRRRSEAAAERKNRFQELHARAEAFRNRDPAAERRNRETTQKLLEAMVAKMRPIIRRNGEIFSDQAGADALPPNSKDGFGNPFRYEQFSATEFVIRSSGVDGKFGTTDDLTGKSEVSEGLKTKQLPQPTDVEEAKKMFLESPGQMRKQIGIQWLIDNKAKLDTADLLAVIDSIVSRLDLRDLLEQKEIANLVDSMIAKDDRQAKDDLIRKLDSRRFHEAASLVMAQLGRDGLRDEVLGYYNLPNENLSDEANRLLARMGVTPKEKKRRSIEDLQDPERRDSAIRRLGRTRYAEPENTEIARKILDALTTGRISTGSSFISAHKLNREELKPILQRLITEDMIPEVCAAYRQSQDYDRGLANYLFSVEDPRVTQVFLDTLDTRGPKGGLSFEGLKRSPPETEEQLWPLLSSESNYETEKICEVLAEIGTSESLLKLNPLLTSKERRVREAAGKAVAAIRAAKRVRGQ